MKLIRAFSALTLAALLVFPADADARKKKKSADSDSDAAAETVNIEDSGVAEFDTVFGEARGIHDTLDQAQADLASANASIAEALGLATDAPLETALNDLKTAAEGKISVAMEGTKPTLSASDAVPANVQAGIDAVNAAVATVSGTVESLAALPDQVTALVDKSKALPGQLSPTLLTDNGLKVTDLRKVTSTVNNNVSAIKDTPTRVTNVTGELNNFLGTVQSTFAE